MIYARNKNIFNQSSRQMVVRYLSLKNIHDALFLEAFDYFTKYPEKYDGATFVKDLVDVNGIDLSAMKHDKVYDIIWGLPLLRWLNLKIIADIQYGEDMAKLGKGNAYWYRVALLIISTPLYPIYKLLK